MLKYSADRVAPEKQDSPSCLPRKSKHGERLEVAMRLIPLTKGKFAMVDDEDFERAIAFKWCAFKGTNRNYTFYAVRRHNGHPQYLHQFILGCNRVDHKNRNGLDCQKKNLRPCTPSQNAFNSGKRKNNTSGYKGVIRADSKWCARIRIGNRKRLYLGRFVTPELAHEAYCQAARKYHGDFARTN